MSRRLRCLMKHRRYWEACRFDLLMGTRRSCRTCLVCGEHWSARWARLP